MSLIVTPGQLNRRAELYHQLGTMLTAGIPLLKALEMVSVRSVVWGSRPVFLAMIADMRSGMTLTQSMERARGWMSDFDIALLAAGEKSGRLDSSFKILSEYYATRAQIIRDTISGLLLPMVNLHVFLIIMPLGLLVSFAWGILDRNYPACIPFLIQKGILFGLLYGLGFLVAYACQQGRGESWRSLVEGFTQNIPIFRKAQRYLALSRLAAALEALISSGISIVDGWELAASASGSPRLRRIVAPWRSHVDVGLTPAELVNQSDYFPEMFANYYLTGEQSGKLDDALLRLHGYYKEEGLRALRMFTRVTTGIIYGGVALAIAIYVVRFWMQYYGALFNSV